MATAKDISIKNDDVVIENGDFSIVPSDQQHVQDLIQSNTGEYKEFPLLGVGAKNYINSSGRLPELRRAIIWNLKSDGYNVRQISINGNEISIDSQRIK
jgi:hypothetical protein